MILRHHHVLTITKFGDKFEREATVHDLKKGQCGRKKSVSYERGMEAVVETLTRRCKKSMRQAPQESGVSKANVHRILRQAK